MYATTERDKDSFIELAIANNVLKFGNITLKSGRVSPYFFNMGAFYQGNSLRIIGHYYADCLLRAQVDIHHLFGPAYKGLPLATATAIALAERGLNVDLSFNRKETKDHGEGGKIIGAPLRGSIVMIDDVISAGTAFREIKSLVEEQDAYLSTVIIALNRCERGQSDLSAIDEIRASGIQVLSIIDFHDLINFLSKKGRTTEVEHMQNYYAKYGS